MMRIVRYSVLPALIVLLSAIVSPANLSAQGVDDFTITSFSADYELSNDHPQGLLLITESIDLDFRGQNRGILRAIPKIYGKQDVNPVIMEVQRDGEREPYTTHGENENLVVRIGDPDVYITGQHSYELMYQVENVIRFHDTHDEFFWDVNGTDWGQPFLAVDARIRTEAELDTDNLPICFTGVQGSTDQDCRVQSGKSSAKFTSESILQPGQTLSAVMGFEKGYFTPKPWLQRNWRYLAAAVVVIPQAYAAIRAYRRWRSEGKDYKDRGVRVPYYTRPKDMSVLQAYYVATHKLTPSHVSATIIDLAARGFISIKETGSGRKLKHELVLQAKSQSALTEEETILLKALFESNQTGDSVAIEDKANKLHSTLRTLKRTVDKAAQDSGMFEISPLRSGHAFKVEYGLGFAVVLIGFFAAPSFTPLLFISSGLTLATVLIFGSLMTKRSKQGELLQEHVEGIEKYIRVAEKDRIKALQAAAAPLAQNAEEPERSVKLFESLLPFAVASGIETTWAKAFKDIYTEPPEWYQGNWSSFSTATLASSLSKTNSSINTSFTAPASSSGSGFSGGGSAGGGGGGGGGGGW